MAALLLAAVLLGGCSNAYRNLQPSTNTEHCLPLLQPNYNNVLFRAEVEVQQQSLGGLLLVKTMPDSTRRVVFTSATGLGFFDFAFGGTKGFEVISIVEKMDKKLVIDALRQDFGLMLFEGTAAPAPVQRIREGEKYFGYPSGEKTNWYVTDSSCATLKRAELGAPRRPLADIHWWLGNDRIPDSIRITHHNFRFNIRLTKLAR